MTTQANEKYAYIIVFHDPGNPLNSNSIPSIPEIPCVAYKSIQEGQYALATVVNKFEMFNAAAYGKAYPYENKSFESEMSANGFALFGWVTMMDDEETVRVPIGLARFSYSG